MIIVTLVSKFSHMDVSRYVALVLKYNSTVVSNVEPEKGVGSFTTTEHTSLYHSLLPSWNTVLSSCSNVGLFLTCTLSFWFPVMYLTQPLARERPSFYHAEFKKTSRFTLGLCFTY